MAQITGVVRDSTGLAVPAGSKMVPVPLIVKNNFRNVPDHYTQDWIIMSPGNLDTVQFFFKKG